MVYKGPRAKKAKLKCSTCAKKFERKLAVLKPREHYYCSYDCMAEHYRKRWREERVKYE